MSTNKYNSFYKSINNDKMVLITIKKVDIQPTNMNTTYMEKMGGYHVQWMEAQSYSFIKQNRSLAPK